MTQDQQKALADMVLTNRLVINELILNYRTLAEIVLSATEDPKLLAIISAFEQLEAVCADSDAQDQDNRKFFGLD